MKSHRIVRVLANAGGVPLAIAATQAAAVVLPFPVAAVLGAGLCGYAGYALTNAVRKLLQL